MVVFSEGEHGKINFGNRTVQTIQNLLGTRRSGLSQTRQRRRDVSDRKTAAYEGKQAKGVQG